MPNLEDKVPTLGGGDVMDEQEHERIHVNTNELENKDLPVSSIALVAERRGIQERRPPKALTDFFLF
ncbi:hypothetical protein GOBAR_AA17229 [Gossypium barbadense]|uniref:Uncharacterized protein n=1 Tax=Gossypium barbadense TaxID=3634 RepID=A0A2P5XJF0_GOSBA|nr:hypothetical protein GOBAR_AA17229 [Gossypium barbadense]